MKMRILVALGAAILAGPAAAEDWSFNGFVTAGGGIVLEDGETYYGLDDDLGFDALSKVGLQVDNQFTDNLFGTVQVVANGADDWEADIEWAFLAYDFNDHWRLRAGRLRGPFYLVSDYLQVGYAYPWLRPPSEVYSRLPINTFEGIDLLYTVNAGDWSTQTQAYFAGLNEDVELLGAPAKMDLNDIFGIAVTSGNDWLTLRASYNEAEMNIEVPQLEQLFAGISQAGAGLVQAGTGLGIPPLVDAGNAVLGIPADMNIIKKKGQFLEAGFIVDPGENWFARGEWTALRFDRNVFGGSDHYYVTSGLRQGAFTYHLTWALSEETPETGFSDPLVTASAIITPVDPVTGATLDFLAATVDGTVGGPEEIETWTLGARWDFISGAAFKLEYAQTDNQLNDYGVVSFGFDLVF